MTKKNGTTNKVVEKKVAKKKPAKKKAVKRKAPKQKPGVMAVISYDEIAKPEMYKSKFNIGATKLTTDQIKAIVAPTPLNVVSQRPGKGGGTWDFIPGWWFKKKLNFVFGFDGWTTEIDGERIDGNFITVKGRLIILNTKDGKPMVSKSDYGSKEIMFKRGSKEYLHIGNDFKAAQTDLIKRCAVQLGFAMDVYGKAESLNTGVAVSNQPQNITVVDSGEPEYAGECHSCGSLLNKAVADFSKRMFKKPYCTDCQKIIKNQK